MTKLILILITSISLAFTIKQIDGPFNILSKTRIWLLNTSIGPIFYKLISCYYCLGFHTSYISYLILTEYSNYNIRDLIGISFGGAIVVMIASSYFFQD